MKKGFRQTLIEMDSKDPEVGKVLSEIHSFTLGTIKSLSREDLDAINRYGFRFKTKTLAGKREEIKQFLLEHPSLMGSDTKSIKRNFKYLGNILPKQESESYSDSYPEPVPKKKPKKAKSRKGIQVQESTYESSTEESFDSLPRTNKQPIVVEYSSSSEELITQIQERPPSRGSQYSTYSSSSQLSHRSKRSHKSSKSHRKTDISDEELF